MSDAAGAGEGSEREPTEEELRAYLAQLRLADVNEVVAQAFSMLAAAAEVKLGRRDGRLLIDATAALREATADRVDARLTQQMDQALQQLRLAQVDAEQQLGRLRAEGQLEGDEPGDLPAAGGPTPAPEGQPAVEEPPPAASRLWVPGRS